KRKKLKKVINYLKRIPSIECIALCNSMPFHFTKPSSDIDLFIIASGGRLWSTRLSAVSPLIALKQRPGEAVKNPIDISFFISGKCLSIEELKIQENDLYLAVWVQSLVPLYENRAGIFDLFLEKNIWAKKMLPNSENNLPGKLEVRPIIQLPIGFSEGFAQWVQEKRLPERIKMLANQGTEVVVNADMLKFHLNDRRQEILQFIEKEICKSES
ncbi:hypothetical protein KJ766_01375, partial [Patescibacteria group bacterium]|nr:hypothetical protein [Patescibacteria group bacterium]